MRDGLRAERLASSSMVLGKLWESRRFLTIRFLFLKNNSDCQWIQAIILACPGSIGGLTVGGIIKVGTCYLVLFTFNATTPHYWESSSATTMSIVPNIPSNLLSPPCKQILWINFYSMYSSYGPALNYIPMISCIVNSLSMSSVFYEN